RYPPSHGCPWCGTLEWTWQEVSGRGHIYSYEIVAHAIQPGFKEWTPYAVVLVELDEQRGTPTEHEAIRLIANLVTPDFRPEKEDNVAIGKSDQMARLKKEYDAHFGDVSDRQRAAYVQVWP